MNGDNIENAIALIMNPKRIKKDLNELKAKDRMMLTIELLKVLSKDVKADPKDKEKSESELDKLFKNKKA